jgi:hypothetical protein
MHPQMHMHHHMQLRWMCKRHALTRARHLHNHKNRKKPPWAPPRGGGGGGEMIFGRWTEVSVLMGQGMTLAEANAEVDRVTSTRH